MARLSLTNRDETEKKIEFFLQRLGTKENTVFYFDGNNAEKTSTHENRDKAKAKSLDLAEKELKALRAKVEADRPRWAKKQRSRKIDKTIKVGWTWTLEDRTKLANFLIEQGWRVEIA
ncbi:hypothetical protein BGX26_005943, partial [Mortierella sp. AD094]